jgi:hypothetical protein
MRWKMKRALELASNESGAGRNVMILVPDASWMSGPMTSELSDVYGAIYTRCTTHHAGLKMVTIDTLILVAPDTLTWNAKGEVLARERLRTSLNPIVIKVGAKP